MHHASLRLATVRLSGEFNIVKLIPSAGKIIYYSSHSNDTKPFWGIFPAEKNPIQHASPEVVQLSMLRFVCLFPVYSSLAMDHSDSDSWGCTQCLDGLKPHHSSLPRPHMAPETRTCLGWGVKERQTEAEIRWSGLERPRQSGSSSVRYIELNA